MLITTRGDAPRAWFFIGDLLEIPYKLSTFLASKPGSDWRYNNRELVVNGGFLNGSLED